MSSLHTAIPTPSFCSFWHGHPYIPIHFLKMFFILYIVDTGSFASGKRWLGGWGVHGRAGSLILADEQVQPVGERLFGLQLKILARVCPSQTW